MTVREFYNMIDSEYPCSLSCDWDNDGIMCCADPDARVNKVLVSLDATYEAVNYASENGFDVLLTHHPMIFRKMKSVTSDDYCGSRVISALASGLTVMSFHTRFDAGKGGVNDCLVSALGFISSGVFGDEESPELGRIVDLASPMTAEDVALLCKEKLGAQSVRLTGQGKISRIAAVGGAGGDFADAALAAGADLLITGECSYNTAQDAAEKGLCVIEAGHFHTEFPSCVRLLEFVNAAGAVGEIFDSCTHKTF